LLAMYGRGRRMRVRMANDRPDNPGILVPPPLIYLLPLLVGLALDRRVHVAFLPRGVVRTMGWPLVGGAVALSGWSFQTLRSADTTARPDKPASRVIQHGPFGHRRNPSRSFCDALIWDSGPQERFLGHPPVAVGVDSDPARGDRA
jgi:protein-S-isoprenylcysteine O-methyltransferase Ste14